MKVSDITAYLIELERSQFSGSITLDFHRGDVVNTLRKVTTEKIKEKE